MCEVILCSSVSVVSFCVQDGLEMATDRWRHCWPFQCSMSFYPGGIP